MPHYSSQSISSIILFLHLIGAYSTTFTVINKCTYTVWPATLSSAGIDQLPPATTGFSLPPGANSRLTVPATWSGRVWARTLCSTGQAGNFSCATADCGTNSVQCSGSGSKPPATLAEFTLKGAGGMDFYDVSLVDGYNLPMMVRPVGGSGNCSSTGCVADLNGSCPAQLKVMLVSASNARAEGVACKSACEAFGDPQYCCSGAHATPDTCKPSSYSEFFKSSCPSAYSYAYDDATSTFTCTGPDYVITFCPSVVTTGKSSGPPTTLETSPTTSYDFPYFSGSIISTLPTSSIGLVIFIVWAILF